MAIMCELIHSPQPSNIIITLIHESDPDFRELDQFKDFEKAGLCSDSLSHLFLSPSVYPAFFAFQAHLSLAKVYRDSGLNKLQSADFYSSCFELVSLASSSHSTLDEIYPESNNVLHDLQLVGWLSSRSCRPLVACSVGEPVTV